MIKKIILYSLLILFVVLLLIFMNYQKAQTNLRQARETQFSIEWSKFSDSAKVNEPVNLSWKVTAPDTFSTTKTGIYWNYESSPSALTKFDSPDAVAYHNFTYDYANGLFRLPDTFDANLSFQRVGVVFLRAYAFIGKDHLWTQERQILIK